MSSPWLYSVVSYTRQTTSSQGKQRKSSYLLKSSSIDSYKCPTHFDSKQGQEIWHEYSQHRSIDIMTHWKWYSKAPLSIFFFFKIAFLGLTPFFVRWRWGKGAKTCGTSASSLLIFLEPDKVKTKRSDIWLSRDSVTIKQAHSSEPE